MDDIFCHKLSIIIIIRQTVGHAIKDLNKKLYEVTNTYVQSLQVNVNMHVSGKFLKIFTGVRSLVVEYFK